MPSPRLVRLVPGLLPERSDDELMTLAQAGMREAFTVLIERHADRLVQACSRLLNDADAGAELAQETWVTVWTQRSRYRAEGKFIVWLITAGAKSLSQSHSTPGRRKAPRAAVGRRPRGPAHAGADRPASGRGEATPCP
jgi:RNA polymerase sigma-70 factor (ECF subfamily)